MSIRTEVGGILQEQLPGPLSRHGGEGRPESGQPHLVGEDFYQDPVFPQPVPQEKLVLCAHGHVLADSNHPVVSKHCRYVLTQELDEARLLWQDGVRRYEDLRVPSLPTQALGWAVVPECTGLEDRRGSPAWGLQCGTPPTIHFLLPLRTAGFRERVCKPESTRPSPDTLAGSL